LAPASPLCESHVAIGGSLLIFTGNPGALRSPTGIYQGRHRPRGLQQRDREQRERHRRKDPPAPFE
jgi:hypothetical protein